MRLSFILVKYKFSQFEKKNTYCLDRWGKVGVKVKTKRYDRRDIDEL